MCLNWIYICMPEKLGNFFANFDEVNVKLYPFKQSNLLENLTGG